MTITGKKTHHKIILMAPSQRDVSYRYSLMKDNRTLVNKYINCFLMRKKRDEMVKEVFGAGKLLVHTKHRVISDIIFAFFMLMIPISLPVFFHYIIPDFMSYFGYMALLLVIIFFLFFLLSLYAIINHFRNVRQIYVFEDRIEFRYIYCHKWDYTLRTKDFDSYIIDSYEIRSRAGYNVINRYFLKKDNQLYLYLNEGTYRNESELIDVLNDTYHLPFEATWLDISPKAMRMAERGHYITLQD